MGSLIPGAFPIELLSAARSTSIEPSINKWNTLHIEEDKLTAFKKSEYLVSKARSQRHMLRHLDKTVVVLSGLQLIKYCHLACIWPFIIDSVVQVIISVKAITEPDNWSTLETIDQGIKKREQETGDPNTTFRSNLTKFVLALIYGKFILNVFYHVLFFFWLKLIADGKELEYITNGSWWLVSFIGESVPEYDPSSNIWLRLWQLGLFQLILIDFIILILQLTLYQCVFKQSTKSLEGLPLGIAELETVRPFNMRVSGESLRKLPEQITPNILNIRLHDCFNPQSYLGFVVQ